MKNKKYFISLDTHITVFFWGYGNSNKIERNS